MKLWKTVAVALAAFGLLAKAEAALVSSAWNGGKDSFAIDADAAAVRLEATTDAESVEFYLIPDGGTFEYYVFGVAADGTKEAHFYSESGNIEPDPFAPAWNAAVEKGAKGKWTVKASVPLVGFYMTRSAAWKTDWKVNVAARTKDKAAVWSGGLAPERTKKFLDTFKTVKGFPKRPAADDLFIRSAVAAVTGLKDGKPSGELKLSVDFGHGADYTVETPWSEPFAAQVPFGGGKIRVPAVFPGAGRFPITIRLVRKDGQVFARDFPVYVGYEPIRLKLTKPQYRDNFYPGQDADTVEGVATSVSGAPVELTLEGPGFAKQTVKAAKDGTFRFNTRGFRDGDATLTAKNGTDTSVKKVRKLPPLPAGQHMTWIENGNLVLDGKPICRRNIYAEGFMGGKAFDERFKADNLHDTKAIREIANLDLAWFAKDLKYTEGKRDQMPSKRVFDVIDEKMKEGAKRNGTHYYISDEPECHGTSGVYLRHIYDYVAEKDPYHVIASCCRSGDTYIDIADWFETHPYINPHVGADGGRVYGRDFRELGGYVDAFHPDQHPDKCVGGAPTAFAYSLSDYPTFEEYVLNFWCEMTHGAKTMYPYAYHDLGDRPSIYEGTRYMFESMEALEPVLTRGARKLLVRTEAYECALWTMPEGDRMFALVNMTQKPQKATVPGLAGNYREFRGTRAFNLSTVQPSTFNLQPLESVIATEKAYDKGLKPLADVRKEIAAAEHARTHRNSVLNGRHGDMDIVTSFGRRGAWRDDAIKVFDGTLDVIAWRDDWNKDKFFEMAFTKFVPSFSEISVYGRNIDGCTVRIRRAGEWVDLKPSATEKAGDRITLKFGETLSTVKMRLGFPKNFVEVYEIELPGKAREIAASGKAAAHKGVFWTMKPEVVTNAVNWSVKHPDEPSFLVFTLPNCPPVADNAYLNWQLHDINGAGTLCHSVSHMLPGLYTLRYPAAKKTSANNYLRVYDWNFRLDFGEIVCCKLPADCAELVEKDGNYRVRVKLSAPCEDMTCSFFEDVGRGARPFLVGNGRNSLDLKPLDASHTLWSGTVPVRPYPNPNKRPFPFVTVNVLGGSLTVPIHTWLSHESH